MSTHYDPLGDQAPREKTTAAPTAVERVLHALRALDPADERPLTQRRADIEAVLPEVRAAVAAHRAPGAVRCLVPGGALPDWRTALRALIALARPFDGPGFVWKGHVNLGVSLRFREWVAAAQWLMANQVPASVPPEVAVALLRAQARVVRCLLCQAAREGRLLGPPYTPAPVGAA